MRVVVVVSLDVPPDDPGTLDIEEDLVLVVAPPVPRAATTAYHKRMLSCSIRRALVAADFDEFHALLLAPADNMLRLWLTAHSMGLADRCLPLNSPVSRLVASVPQNGLSVASLECQGIPVAIATDLAAARAHLVKTGTDYGLQVVVVDAHSQDSLHAQLELLTQNHPDIDHLYAIPAAGDSDGCRLLNHKAYPPTRLALPETAAPIPAWTFVWHGDPRDLPRLVAAHVASVDLWRSYARGRDLADCALALDVAWPTPRGALVSNPVQALVESRINDNEYTRLVFSRFAKDRDLLVEAWAAEWAHSTGRKPPSRTLSGPVRQLIAQRDHPLVFEQDAPSFLKAHHLVSAAGSLQRTRAVLRAKLEALQEIEMVVDLIKLLLDPDSHRLQFTRFKDVVLDT